MFLASHLAMFGHPGSGNTSYLSTTIAEEFLLIMGKVVTDEVISDIKKGKYFPLIVNSSPDFLHIDQLSIIIRYVKRRWFHLLSGF